MSCFRFIMTWPGSFAVGMNWKIQKLASSKPSRTSPTIHTTWVTYKLTFRIDNGGSKIQDPRLRALGIHQKLGVAKEVGDCTNLLQKIGRAMNTRSTNSHVPNDKATAVVA